MRNEDEWKFCNDNVKSFNNKYMNVIAFLNIRRLTNESNEAKLDRNKM